LIYQQKCRVTLPKVGALSAPTYNYNSREKYLKLDGEQARSIAPLSAPLCKADKFMAF